ncbi:MAG: hypothetical protein KJZ83_18985 [Burkholderiaceae bacterium]|nr:hypothetical protein [Burkholderiaceae bacterium]
MATHQGTGATAGTGADAGADAGAGADPGANPGADPDAVARTSAALAAGAVYFAAVFAAGFVLGVLRTLFLLPLVGPLWAVLVELPVILGIAWRVCARVLRHRPLARAAAVGMGAVAFSLLMLGEAGVSLLLAGRSLDQHLALYAQLPHQLGLVGQLVFAAFPWIQARRRPPGSASAS